MFDVKTVLATPGTARRLLEFANVGNISFDEKLVELAMQGLLSKEDLAAFPCDLPDEALPTLQHISDWQGRAILLCGDNEPARKVALANAWLKSATKQLILAQPKFYPDWCNLILEIWPEAKISVFGNMRYQNNLKYPDGIKFTESADFEADFFITSYTGVLWNDLLGRVTVDQTIVEELDCPSAFANRWEHSVTAIFKEIPHPIFIQNINSLPVDPGKDIFTCLQMPNSKASNFLANKLIRIVWGFAPVSKLGSIHYHKEAENYLALRNYHGLDFAKILEMLGVSSHMLKNVTASSEPMVFRDSKMLNVKSGKNKTSGLYRIYERELELEDATGRKLSDVVRGAVMGDPHLQTLVGALRTSQIATMKAVGVKASYTNIASKMTRSLFLVEDSPFMKRALGLQFGQTLEDLSKSPHTKITTEGFFWPHDVDGVGMSWQDYQSIKPINNLIVSIDELIAEPRFLLHANFLFVPEIPLDREDFHTILDAANSQGTRVILNIIESSFDEEIFKQIMKKS